MKLLILGGTVFVGRYLVEAALQRGHSVSMFNRGYTNRKLFPEVEHLRGDRHEDVQALAGKQWDVVIDTSGYLPRAVRASADLLNDVDTYIYISSGSVYKNLEATHIDELSPVQDITAEDLAEAETTRTVESPTAASYGQHYGGLKAECEEVIEQTLPERTLIIRPGLIVGPHDYSNRFTYWLQRVAKGGQCLAPNHPDTPISVIDARDLAQWTIFMAEKRQTGIYNATGKQYGLTFGRYLEACKKVTGSDAQFVWVDADFLLKQDVQPWLELPLWLPKQFQGMLLIDDQKAVKEGLTYRSIDETVTDTLSWLVQEPPHFKIDAGMDEEKELSVLRAWHQFVDSS